MAEKDIMKGGSSTPVTNTIKYFSKTAKDEMGKLSRNAYQTFLDIQDNIPKGFTTSQRKTPTNPEEDKRKADQAEVSKNLKLEIKEGFDRGNYINSRDWFRGSDNYIDPISDLELTNIMRGKKPNKIVFVKKRGKNPNNPVVDVKYIYDLPDFSFEREPIHDDESKIEKYKIKKYNHSGLREYQYYTLDEIRKKFHIFEKDQKGGKTKIRRNKKSRSKQSRKFTQKNRH